ncbi:MAG TPA: metallophosphoesterase [Thermoanaerobaculia bacterium]|nr:metallophosphoesterase [Thermoanaerobaculia bacterium]
MALQTVRILHISDLHDRGGRETEAWRRRRVLGEGWEENLTELLQDGPIDLVCFTGDAADWGQPEEFETAAVFLHAILERLGLSPERLFVVPGNHDLDRNIAADAWQAVREAADRVDPLALARWLHGKDVPFGFDPNWRDHLFTRFAAYRYWVAEQLGRPELLAGHAAGGPHSYRVSLHVHGVPLHVIGLDSSWLCGDDHDARRLRVTDEQAMAQLTVEGRPLEGFRLVLVHHPLDDLHSADQQQVRRCLADHADLVLRGHLHEPEASSWADPDRRLQQLAAGCLYEGHQADQYPNACQLLRLRVDPGGASPLVDVRFRSFSPRGGHWFDDPSLYREATNGRIRLVVGGRPARATDKGANPFDFAHPALPPRFFGRRGELQRLEAALTDGNGTSVVGDWRIGKTSLLRTWERKAKELGRTVVFLDGQAQEGASIQALVSKILGRPAPETADSAADALDGWVRSHPAGLDPVVLIDELDGLIERFDRRFFERLREMLDRLALTVASRRPVDQLYKERGLTSPFDGRLRVSHLALLEANAAEQLLAVGTELAPEDLALMRHWAGRHPFHLQLLGHCLVQARRFGETRQKGLDDYLDTAYSRLRELWQRLGDREKEALLGCLTGSPTGLRSLRRRGLVDEDGKPFGEILVQWLREEL